MIFMKLKNNKEEDNEVKNKLSIFGAIKAKLITFYLKIDYL